MRVFITGASGFIGSSVIPELQKAGHSVVGLARSDASAKKLEQQNVEVQRGEITDLDTLRSASAKADAVIHLGFLHDRMSEPNGFMEAVQVDRAAIDAICKTLDGSGKPFLFASGTLGIAPGQVLTEDTAFDAKTHPRMANAAHALSFVERNVRVVPLRFSPSVHGRGDHGFIKMLIDTARARGFSGYLGDGANRWTAIHRLDAGRLTALALQNASPGFIVHAVADESVSARTIAEAIGRGTKLPVKAVAPEAAAEHFGPFMTFAFAMDQPASSAKTRQALDWAPQHPGLVADIEAGHYFDAY